MKSIWLKKWVRVATVAMAGGLFGLGGLAAYSYTNASDDCCAREGSPCCYPGSPCCAGRR